MPPYDAIDMRVARRFGFVTVCALAATVSRAGTPPGHELPQHATPRFFTSTEAVRVDVSVRRSDHPVTGLQAADFDVRDDGVPQDVELIGYEELPLDLALVLDTSGSVKGARLRHLIDAAEAVFDGVKPGDRVALLAFSDTVYLQIPPTEDIERVRRAVRGLKAGGMTALLDATYASLSLATAPGRRVAVILFTDGIDTNSTRIASVVLDGMQALRRHRLRGGRHRGPAGQAIPAVGCRRNRRPGVLRERSGSARRVPRVVDRHEEPVPAQLQADRR